MACSEIHLTKTGTFKAIFYAQILHSIINNFDQVMRYYHRSMVIIKGGHPGNSYTTTSAVWAADKLATVVD